MKCCFLYISANLPTGQPQWKWWTSEDFLIARTRNTKKNVKKETKKWMGNVFKVCDEAKINGKTVIYLQLLMWNVVLWKDKEEEEKLNIIKFEE